jgi:hypothetical protein
MAADDSCPPRGGGAARLVWRRRCRHVESRGSSGRRRGLRAGCVRGGGILRSVGLGRIRRERPGLRRATLRGRLRKRRRLPRHGAELRHDDGPVRRSLRDQRRLPRSCSTQLRPRDRPLLRSVRRAIGLPRSDLSELRFERRTVLRSLLGSFGLLGSGVPELRSGDGSLWGSLHGRRGLRVPRVPQLFGERRVRPAVRRALGLHRRVAAQLPARRRAARGRTLRRVLRERRLPEPPLPELRYAHWRLHRAVFVRRRLPFERLEVRYDDVALLHARLSRRRRLRAAVDRVRGVLLCPGLLRA